MPYPAELVHTGSAGCPLDWGHGQWVISFFPENDGPVPNSLGDETAEGGVAFYFGDCTLLSRKYLVPRGKALELVKMWFEEAVVSQAIRWTDKMYRLTRDRNEHRD